MTSTEQDNWKTRSSTRLPFFALAGIAAYDQIRRQQAAQESLLQSRCEVQ
jgi:hypothetical protein